MPNVLARFYYRSFCDLITDADFSGSTDYVSGSLANVNDRDKTTCAITSGKNSDATSVDFIIDLGAGFNLDTVALWANFRDFEVFYSASGGGGSWVSLKAYTANSNVFTLSELYAPVYAGFIKITTTATNPSNQEKKLYEVVVTAKICDLPISTIDTPEQNYTRITASNIRGGSIQLVLFPQSPKFRAVLNFKFLTSNYAAYDSLKNQFVRDACLMHLYYSDLISQLGNEAFYLVNDIAQKVFPLSADVLASGVDGSIDAVEV
jgi:hypothetical protein